MEPQRYLVTGAMGCIGAWVVRNLLQDGHAAIAFDASQDDHRLRLILEKDEFHRSSMINTLLEEMRYKGAPEALITAIAGLLDRHVAHKAYELLKG